MNTRFFPLLFITIALFSGAASVHAAALYTITNNGGGCSVIGIWDAANKTCTLTRDLTNIDSSVHNGISVTGTGITLDGAGYTLAASTTGSGIAIDLTNSTSTTIKNITVRSFGIGINIPKAAPYAYIASSTFDGVGSVIYDTGGIGLTVAGSDFKNGGTAFVLENTSGGTYFLNDIEASMHTAAHIFSSRSQLFFNNNFYQGGITNGYQTIQYSFSRPLPIGGNYWSRYDESSEGCTDADGDGVCDAPLNLSNSLGTDAHPYVHPSGWETYNWPPKISLNDITSLYVVQGGTVTLPSVTAIDREDGDISNKVTATYPTIDTNVLGTTRIRYDVSDSQGKPATPAYRTVTIVPNDSYIPLWGVPLLDTHGFTDVVAPTYDSSQYGNAVGFRFRPSKNISNVHTVGLSVFIHTAVNFYGQLKGNLHLVIAKDIIPQYLSTSTDVLANVVIPKGSLPLVSDPTATSTDPVYITLPSPLSFEAGHNYYLFLERESHSSGPPYDIGVYGTYTDGELGDSSNNFVELTCNTSMRCNTYSSTEIPFALYSKTPTTTPPTPKCCSSVAFLPGIEASRLYGPDQIYGTNERRLWEPSIDLDTLALAMNTDGTSKDPTIHTKTGPDGAVIEPFDNPLLPNVYKSFFNDLKDMKNAGTIHDYEVLPYDWRLAFSDVLSGGSEVNGNVFYEPQYATDSPYIYQELENLANHSDTKKVTIIAHSMGGLLIKKLLADLEDNPNHPYRDLLGKIDTVILVDSPQLGTPQGAAALLHGYNQELDVPVIGWPNFTTAEAARKVAEYMPSAYTLLPSKMYFNRVNDVDPDGYVSSTTVIAGTNPDITNYSALRNYLIGKDRPPVTDENDLLQPFHLPSSFIDEAQTLHDRIDNFQIPDLDGNGRPDFHVVQIAGWGLPDTIKGIKYVTKTRGGPCPPPLTGSCPEYYLDFQPIPTVDGDGTVVTPSEIAMQNKPGVDTWYLDLFSYNSRVFLKRSHADILEVGSVRDLIRNLILGTPSPAKGLPYITNDFSILKPSEQNEKLIRLSLHSPISPNVYDSSGNHLGMLPDGQLEENIPNSYYFKMGEGTYFGVPDTGEQYTINLSGTALGTFTFDLEEDAGDTVVATTSFADVPVTASTTATFTLTSATSVPMLAIDEDGDGTVDANIVPGQKISAANLFALLRGAIRTLGLSKPRARQLIRIINKIEHLLSLETRCSNIKKPWVQNLCEKGLNNGVSNAFDRLIRRIEILQKQGRLSDDDSSALISVIQEIKGKVLE